MLNARVLGITSKLASRVLHAEREAGVVQNRCCSAVAYTNAPAAMSAALISCPAITAAIQAQDAFAAGRLSMRNAKV
jgi:hypothetical protein